MLILLYMLNPVVTSLRRPQQIELLILASTLRVCESSKSSLALRMGYLCGSIDVVAVFQCETN